MTTPEKDQAKRLAELVAKLPDEKKAWLLGYGEGMADARDAQHPDEAKEPA